MLQHPHESFWKNAVPFGAFHDLSTQRQWYFASTWFVAYFVCGKAYYLGRIHVRYMIQTIKISWSNFDSRVYLNGRWVGIYEKEKELFRANTEYELLFRGGNDTNMLEKDLTGLHCLKYNLTCMFSQILYNLFLFRTLVDHVFVIHLSIFLGLLPSSLSMGNSAKFPKLQAPIFS